MKKYINISKKRDIANKVVLMSSENMDGIIKIDSFKRKIYTFMFAAEEYLEKSFGDDFDALMDQYDELMQSGVADQIKALDDYTEFEFIVMKLVSDTEKCNSVEHSVAKMCQSIVGAIENISDALADKISEFDTDILKDANVVEIMSVINKLK